MGNIQIPPSDWDGKLPPHVANNEKIWWELFPQIKVELPPIILRLFDGAKELPTREMVGKVVLVADTKSNLRRRFAGAGLLNEWGCYCNTITKGNDTFYSAGTLTKSFLDFLVPFASFAPVQMRFIVKADSQLKCTDAEKKKFDESMIEHLRWLDIFDEMPVFVKNFRHGSWENGLDITFRAAIWLNSNEEEALAQIWRIKSTKGQTKKTLIQNAASELGNTLASMNELSQYLCIYYNKTLEKCEYQNLYHPPLCPVCPYKKYKTSKELGLDG